MCVCVCGVVCSWACSCMCLSATRGGPDLPDQHGVGLQVPLQCWFPCQKSFQVSSWLLHSEMDIVWLSVDFQTVAQLFSTSFPPLLPPSPHTDASHRSGVIDSLNILRWICWLVRIAEIELLASQNCQNGFIDKSELLKQIYWQVGSAKMELLTGRIAETDIFDKSEVPKWIYWQARIARMDLFTSQNCWNRFVFRWPLDFEWFRSRLFRAQKWGSI